MSEIWFDDDWDFAELEWLNELATETASILGLYKPGDPDIEEGDVVTISGFGEEFSALVSKVTALGEGECVIEFVMVPEENSDE